MDALRPNLRSHLAFTAASALLLMLMFAALRMALLHHNAELIGETSTGDLLEAFANGARFDLRVVVPWRRCCCRFSACARWPRGARMCCG
jgi:hypothetical protein